MLNIVPNSWSKQIYVQVFDCESITFKAYYNMFGRTVISESMYEGLVEPSYKNLLGHIPIVLVTSGKWEDNMPHQILTLRWMIALASAENSIYIIRRDIFKHTCIIYGLGHSSDWCKVLGDFVSNYSKIRPTNDPNHDPDTIKNINRQKNNNYIVNNEVD